MLDLVRNSDWSTLLSVTAIMRELATASLAIQPVLFPVMSVEFFVVHPARRSLSPAALKFAEAVEHGFAENLKTWADLQIIAMG